MNKSKQKDSLIFTDKRLEFLFVYFGSSSLLVSKVANDQPRSQSSSAISDVTSPVKLVGKIRQGKFALGSKSPLVTRVAQTGLSTRLVNDNKSDNMFAVVSKT